MTSRWINIWQRVETSSYRMHSVVIHNYTGSLSAIEFGDAKDEPGNFVVFVGGLGDGFLTVPYVSLLAEAIRKRYGPKWVLVQALISSSYLGFGTGSLNRDAKELAKLVKYLRRERGSQNSKVILMGHSTGSQDTMEYLTKLRTSEKFEPILDIDAAIIQAPASDSEGLGDASSDSNLKELLSKAQELIEEGRSGELMPAAALKYTFGSPATAYRFNSLLGQRGDDDYFSSYLEDSELKNTFGKVRRPLLVLYSEKDEFVPKSVDKIQLLRRWKEACDSKYWSQHSKVVKGASHNVGPQSEEGATEELIQSVLDFIESEF